MERTVVAIGCTPSPDYLFPLPLAAWLWREVVGFQPLLLLTGSEAEWREDRYARVTLDVLDDLQVSRMWIGHAEGLSDATLAQVSRLLTSADWTFFPNTWVMLSDADLWPLQKAFYQQHQGGEHRCVLYYSNGDHFVSKENVLKRASTGRRAQTLPMCHATLRVSDWRAIFDCDAIALDRHPPGLVRERAQRLVTGWMEKRHPEEDRTAALWMSDQQIMTEALCHQEWFPGAVKFIPRRGHPPIDRLDRSDMAAWDNIDVSTCVDMHLPRAPWGADWPAVRRVVEAVAPRPLGWMDKHAAFFRAGLT